MNRFEWMLPLGLATAPLIGATACSREEPLPPVTSPAAAPQPADAPAPTTTAAEPAPTPEPAPVATADGRDAALQPVAEPTRRGRFVLKWNEPKQPELRPLATAVAEAKLFDELMAALNETFRLPADIAVSFENCDDINAFYDPETRTISMCWELIEDIHANFSHDHGDDAEQVLVGTMNATVFTFFHELGHALIDVLDLPVTGKEEDVVDQLATWIALAEGGDDGVRMALDGATSFAHDADAEHEEGDEPITWGEHGLSEQRFYNIVCWIYGHAPDAMNDLRASRKGPLPDERADICEDEWKRLDSAWERLLAEHVVPDPKAANDAPPQ
jgi:hypothetical protein